MAMMRQKTTSRKVLRSALISLVSAVIPLTIASGTALSQELTSVQKKELIQARDLIGKTAIEYRNGDYEDAAATLQQALDQFTQTLSGMDADLRDKTVGDMKALLQRIETAHAMLQLEGVSLAPIRIGDGTEWWNEDAVDAAPVAEIVRKIDAPLQPTKPDLPAEPMTTPSNTETVSFLNDVAPILMDNCNGCHFDAMRVRGGLRMDTFAQLMRGGGEGESIDAGSGDDSILVMRMRGEGGDLMPGGGRPPVPDDQIALIARWIDQGANYDGQRIESPIRDERKQAWMNAASNTEISSDRADSSLDSIRLVAGSQRINTAEAGPFLIVGPGPTDLLERVGRVASGQMKTVESIITKREETDDRHFFRGKATIFVLPRQYDYSEFVGMVEERRVPADWKSHFRYTGLQAYVTLIANESVDDEVVRDRLAAPLVGLAMASRSVDVPTWLSRGVGESIANNRVRRLDRATKLKLQQRTAEAARAAKSAKDFLGDRMAAEQKDALATAIAGSMIDGTRRRAFLQMIRLLNDGIAFADAFQQSYKVTPDVYIDAYLKWAKTR